jgi:lysophospholipase L1-like esterase
MSSRPFRLVVGLLLILPGTVRADAPFYLKDGDRVVFYGDSITEQRLYTTFVETYVVTRFPKMNVAFVHSGWGGDRVNGSGGGPISVRLTRDVFAYKPSVVTIMLGMNDGSYRPFDGKIFDTYSKGMEKIVDRIKADVPGVRITLIEPSPYDDVTRPPNFEGGYNAVLVRFGEFLKELAAKEHVDLADLNTSVVAATKKAFASDPENAKLLNPDRVHPQAGGQLLMAAALLDAWNAPATVSTVKVTASPEGAPKVEAEKTAVSEVTRQGDALAWTQLDESLPFPINVSDPVIGLAVRSSDVLSKLDQQILKVDGLSASDSILAIDGQTVGQFTRAQLAEGVNLAVMATPMLAQARRVHELTLAHNQVHFARWRWVEVPLHDARPAYLAQALAGLDGIEADKIKEQRETAQPKPHRFELRPKP